MATDKIQQQVLSLIEADDPDLEEIQKAAAAVHGAFVEANATVSRLKKSRDHVLLHGTDEEAAEHDEDLRAAERARDRYGLLEERLKPVHQQAAEARKAELAQSAAAELPDLIKAAERAEEDFLVARERLQGVAARVASSDVKLRPEVQKRVEAITGQSAADHGFRPA